MPPGCVTGSRHLWETQCSDLLPALPSIPRVQPVHGVVIQILQQGHMPGSLRVMGPEVPGLCVEES